MSLGWTLPETCPQLKKRQVWIEFPCPTITTCRFWCRDHGGRGAVAHLSPGAVSLPEISRYRKVAARVHFPAKSRKFHYADTGRAPSAPPLEPSGNRPTPQSLPCR